jgi:hypothetical protein
MQALIGGGRLSNGRERHVMVCTHLMLDMHQLISPENTAKKIRVP